MAKPDPNISRPEKTLTLPESDITLTMTYVVFNDILRFVGSIEQAMDSVMTNQEVRDLIIRRMLTDNKKAIQDIKDLVSLEEVEVDIFELDDILAWVMEHVTYFFMKTATRMQASVAKYPAMLEKMTTSSSPSETGSTLSETPTKSAGPTE
jgi:hypothetical protein